MSSLRGKTDRASCEERQRRRANVLGMQELPEVSLHDAREPDLAEKTGQLSTCCPLNSHFSRRPLLSLHSCRPAVAGRMAAGWSNRAGGIPYWTFRSCRLLFFSGRMSSGKKPDVVVNWTIPSSRPGWYCSNTWMTWIRTGELRQNRRGRSITIS
jgi:hypothetical protein